MAAKVYQDIKELKPELQPLVADFLKRAKVGVWHAKLTETYRSQARQLELYKAGKTPAKVSTYHNWRLAFDIAMFKNGRKQVSWDFKLYEKVAPIAEKMGFTWGGRWKVKDGCHFQWEGALPGTKPKGIGKALASELGSRLLGRKWVASASFYNLSMDKFIEAIRKSKEYKANADPCASYKLKIKGLELTNGRLSKQFLEDQEKLATERRVVNARDDELRKRLIELDYFKGRVDKLLERVDDLAKRDNSIMENMADTLVEKEKRIKELESLTNSLTADASLGKLIVDIGVLVKKLLEDVLGRLGKG